MTGRLGAGCSRRRFPGTRDPRPESRCSFPPGMQRALRRRAVRRARAAPPLPVVRHAAAGALRPGRGTGLAARRPDRPARRRCGAIASCCRSVDGEAPVTLGEGFTPLLHAPRLGASLGLDRLFIKDESLNPTNSFKARGLSAAITRAKPLGATHDRAAHRRQRRQCRRGLRRRRRAALPGLHAARCQAALHRRVPSLRRRRDAGRRPHHRRRPHGR